MNRIFNNGFAHQAITPERAWWFGVLLGDGNVYWNAGSGDYRVSVSGSYSTVKRFCALMGVEREPQKFKRANAWQGYLGSKGFVEWLRDTYGLCGPKTHNLPWIDCGEHFTHFARGLWDTDGCLTIDRRRRRGNKGNDSAIASFGVADVAFVERFRDELVERLGAPQVALVSSVGETKVKWAGSSAFKIADVLYKDAPEHLVNDDRLNAYAKLCELRHTLSVACCPSCGAEPQKQGYCTRCWWATRPAKTGPGTVCACGKSPVLARSLCSACYSRSRRAG